MRDFSGVTIVTVDGRDRDLHPAQLALAQSGRQMPGARLLLLSPRRPECLLSGIEHHQIGVLDYFQYNLFVVFALGPFIQTPFALIVQDDGWVVDGGKWSDEFFRYDYVGAPIHLARLTRSTGVSYATGFEWVNHLGDSATEITPVMNGGFSLRSKRLLEAPATHGIDYQVPSPSRLLGPPYAMSWDANAHLEDVQICIHMRARLESLGIAFAPLDVARRFSIECYCPGLFSEDGVAECFGHHSKLRKLKSIDPLVIDYAVPHQVAETVYGENIIADMLRRKGYAIEYAA